MKMYCVCCTDTCMRTLNRLICHGDLSYVTWVPQILRIESEGYYTMEYE